MNLPNALKIAVIGNGAIAKVVTRHCEASEGRLTIIGALVLPEDGQSVGRHSTVHDLDALLAMTPDLIVECASQVAVKAYGSAILRSGSDFMIISVGALANSELMDQLNTAAREGSARILVPSGALAGLDGVSAAAIDRLDSVTLTTRKPPNAWAGAPGAAHVDLKAVTEPTTIFSGSAGEATQAFPKNANVAAALALSGLGMDATTVTLIADPGVTRNSHHVEARGAFGHISVTIDAEPSPENPKTSHLAALSIVRMLDRLTGTIGS